MATLPKFGIPQKEFVSVQEYLDTDYEPDCDYIDGRLEERNLGEHDHSILQTLLAHIFMTNRTAWGVYAATETRVQVKPRNFRIPDVTILRSGTPREQVLTRPPLLVIEILSRRDRLNEISARNQDYIQFNIPNVWIIDPKTRKAWYDTPNGLKPIENNELTVPGTPIRITLSELFAELDAV